MEERASLRYGVRSLALARSRLSLSLVARSLPPTSCGRTPIVLRVLSARLVRSAFSILLVGATHGVAELENGFRKGSGYRDSFSRASFCSMNSFVCNLGSHSSSGWLQRFLKTVYFEWISLSAPVSDGDSDGERPVAATTVGLSRQEESAEGAHTTRRTHARTRSHSRRESGNDCAAEKTCFRGKFVEYGDEEGSSSANSYIGESRTGI